jgi:CheY-like chemotaxis protein
MQPAIQTEITRKPVLARRTILVIDDDASFRLLVRTLLTRGGYQVLEASDGLVGLRLMKDRLVDLMITDMIMPEHEGVETILLAHRLHPQLKIVAISGAMARYEYLDLANRIGADATLDKSIVPKSLLRTVGSLVEPLH